MSHFERVQLTGADVFWLAVYALAGPEGDLANAEAKLRAAYIDERFRVERFSLDLSNLHVEGAILSEAHVEGAVLSRAHLEKTSFRAARMERATLVAAHLETLYVNPCASHSAA